MEAKAFIDGGARPNPGKAGAGVVIVQGNDVILSKHYDLGIRTNNQAEYMACINALTEAKALGITTLVIYSDSQLLVSQIKGMFKVKNKNIIPLHAEAKELMKNFEFVTIYWTPREQNKAADAMSWG